VNAALKSVSSPLPWHAGSVDRLKSAWRQQRWPHALLIYGAEGLGKRRLAEWVAQAVLCDQTRDELQICGQCAACKLIAARTHPDLHFISPEEDKQQISIDRIREACASLSMTSYRQGYKVAIVEPAHQMTIGASNSLLKTLEEPAKNTILILLTSRPSGLPATIRSRCQQLAVHAPLERDALAWLASAAETPVALEVLRFARGAPLRALDLAKGRYSTLSGEIQTAFEALFTGRTDVTQIAKQWNDDDLIDRLLCVDHWIEQKVRKAVGQTDDLVTGMVLPSDAPTLNISRMFVCLDRVRELKATLARTALQRELAIEAILLALLDTFAARRP
jgi:DNA polymerase III subunit delta'